MLAAVAVLFAGTASNARAQSPEEARAIFLYNFAKFVEWPDSAFASSSAPVVIAVVDANEVGRALEHYVRGKNANGRDIEVRQLKSEAGVGDAHIVFIGSTGLTSAVIAEIGSKPILSVAEDESFLQQGGIIRLFSQGNKVMCAINAKNSTAAGLKLGDKLVKASSS